MSDSLWIKSLKVGDPVYVETGSFDDRKLEKDRVHSITQNGIALVKSENYFNQSGTESRYSGWEPLDQLKEWTEENHIRYRNQEVN